MAWHPPQEALAALPNLDVIFSLGAGVEHILSREGLPDVPVARIVSDDLTGRMTEWVTLQVLMHHRQQRRYDRLPARAAAGTNCASRRHRRCGSASWGWARSGQRFGEGACRARLPGCRLEPQRIVGARDRELRPGKDGLDAFLSRHRHPGGAAAADDATRGILAKPLSGGVASDRRPVPVLINAGRGGLQVDADIVASPRARRADRRLSRRVRGGAARPGRARCGAPRVVVTPHCAGWSDPVELTRQIMEQIAAFEAGRPLRERRRPCRFLLGSQFERR